MSRRISSFFLIGEILLWLLIFGVPVLGFFSGFFWKIFLGIFWGCLVWARFFEPKIIRVRTQKISVSLPKFRLAVISDLHVGPLKKRKFVARLVEKLYRSGADAVLIPGDFVWGDAVKFSPELVPFQNLKIPAFATLGNHDHFAEKKSDPDQSAIVENFLKKFGVRVLRNSAEKLGKIWIAGTDDNYSHFHDLLETFKKIPVGAPVILLAHSPSIADEISPALTVSGHTHGGQIRVPILGAIPFVIPTKNGKKLEKGWYAARRIFVSGGVGEVGLGMRFLNFPEITILENVPLKKS